MMELLKSFVLQLVGAAMLSAAALALTPEGRVKKVVQIVCGFVVMAAFLSIAMDFDYRSLSQNMAQYRS